MVWIHGGAYRFGSSADPGYDGATLARAGIVVVTANHRVGVEGYAEIKGAPANRALLDQLAALHWVHDEIRAFGGDPARVTVFGQSAGAGAIAALLVMPLGRDLFSRAIVQSVPGTYFDPALARRITTALVEPIGLTPTVGDLADVSPALLMNTMAGLDRRMPETDQWGPFSPVVDGDILPTDPWTGLAAGAGRDVPLLVGHTRDEWRLFLVLRDLVGGVTDAMADEAMNRFGPGPDAAHRFRSAYPDATAEELYVLVHSDRMFRMPSLQLAAAHTAGGGRSHLYELTWPAPAAGGVFGACHALDVSLVFGTLDQGMAIQLLGDPPPSAARALSVRMQTAWTRFARDARPGWVPYDELRRVTRVFDVVETSGVETSGVETSGVETSGVETSGVETSGMETTGVQCYPEEASRRLWADTPIRVIGMQPDEPSREVRT